MTTPTLPEREAAQAATLPVITHWIDGRVDGTPPPQTQAVYNPATGHVIARVARGGADDVDRAVAAARAAFPAWRDLPLISRSQIFFAYRELVWRHREELASLITRDHGKTSPDALAEVLRGLETIEYACGLPVHLAGMNTPNVSTKVDTLTLRQPLGVAAGITPFNFPAMVPMWIYPIALACGNTFIWKPSSHTPGATQLQAELWAEAGLPDGVFNVVYGGREAVDAMLDPSRDRRDRVRRLDGRGPSRPRDRDARRQAGGRLHRRQERDGRPARCRSRPRGRRGRGGGLRVGRRALHGHHPGHRRRRRG